MTDPGYSQISYSKWGTIVIDYLESVRQVRPQRVRCCPPTQRAIFAIGSSCGMTVAMALLSSEMLGPPQAAL
jgi:hypothetical protein